MIFATDLMKKALETFEARSMYGPADFKKQGVIMHALFPDGIPSATEAECTRTVLLSILVTKLCRYAENASSGGHADSIHDTGVYSFILEAIDANLKIGESAAPDMEMGSEVEARTRAELPWYAIDRWVEFPATVDKSTTWEGYSKEGVNVYRIEEVPGGWSYLSLGLGWLKVADLAEAKKFYENQAMSRGATEADIEP